MSTLCATCAQIAHKVSTYVDCRLEGTWQYVGIILCELRMYHLSVVQAKGVFGGGDRHCGGRRASRVGSGHALINCSLPS